METKSKSTPIDPDAQVPTVISRNPDSPRTQLIRQAKQENFGIQNPDVKLGYVYDLINEAVKDLVRCYRFILVSGGNRPLSLKSSWKIREGILTLFWFLVDLEDIRSDGPAIQFKYIRGVVPFARPDSKTGTIKLNIRSLESGLEFAQDFIQTLSQSSTIKLQKVALTKEELEKKALDAERKTKQLQEAEEKAKERLALEAMVDWKEPPPFEQSTFKSSLAVIAPGLKEEDLDREIAGPRVEKKSSGTGTDSEQQWDESLLSEKERETWNAKGKARFQEEKMHWQLMQFHSLVSQYFGPVRRVEDPDDTDEKTRYKLTDTIYCMNDVQYEFETRYANLDHVKSFVVQIWALPIFSNDEEASLRCKYEGNYIAVEQPSLFGFLAYLREGKDKRFVFERTFVSSAEKRYRSQQTISRTVDSFLAKLTEITQSLVKNAGHSPMPDSLSRAIRNPPITSSAASGSRQDQQKAAQSKPKTQQQQPQQTQVKSQAQAQAQSQAQSQSQAQAQAQSQTQSQAQSKIQPPLQPAKHVSFPPKVKVFD